MRAPESAKTNVMWPKEDGPRFLGFILGGVFHALTKTYNEDVGLVKVNASGVVQGGLDPTSTAQYFYNAVVAAYPGTTMGELVLTDYQIGDTIDISSYVAVGSD